MPRILILADDLTGASDAGAQFAKHGIPTHVLTHWEFMSLGHEDDTGVVVINTESRHMTPDDAFSTVTKIAKAAKAFGIKTIYKKTDSTLRGNIGSEIEAVMKAWGSVFLVYVPAFPDAHRFIRGGVLYVEDRRVTETSFADDILSPVRHSYLPDVIGDQSKVPCQVINLSRLRQNAVDLRQPGYISIIDGETNADLRQTATILRNQEVTGCFAGTAAFAEHLIELLELPSVPVSEPEIHSPVMVVSGSVNPVSLAQLRHGLIHGYVSSQLTPELLFPNPNRSTDSSLQPEIQHACDVLTRGQHLIVHTARTEVEAQTYFRFAERRGITLQQTPQHLMKSVAQFVREVMQGTHVPTLIIFGGETAYTTLRVLGCQRARVQKEISIGANVLEANVLNRPLRLITKSGGFGPRSFLEDFLTCLSV